MAKLITKKPNNPRLFSFRDSRSHLDAATFSPPIKELNFTSSNAWIHHAVVGTLSIMADVFIGSSVLRDAGISFDQVSLLVGNRVLICFSEDLQYFLGLKESLKDYFSSISAWDKEMQSVKRFLWINVVGTPLEFGVIQGNW